VDNAIKYSEPNGRVLVTVSSNTKINGFMTFSVKDFGQGITKEIQSQLFIGVTEIFSQEREKGESSGMGLKICSEIIKLHDGNIECVSTVKKGTEMFFNIPFETPEDSDEEEHPHLS
jgi:signal transduction histidine kinase